MNVQHESQNRLQNLLNEKELEENYNDSTTESFCDFRNLIGYNNIFRSYTLQDARRSGSINQLIQQYNIKTIIDGDDNNIADIIQSISTNEGPYLIYGKDIGIKCSIIEALKTPKFWTLYNGYAQSYYNVYPKQMQNNPSLTVDVQETFKNELASSIELNSHNVQYLNLCKYTKNYLMKHGMTDQMIDAAIGNLNVR